MTGNVIHFPIHRVPCRVAVVADAYDHSGTAGLRAAFGMRLKMIEHGMRKNGASAGEIDRHVDAFLIAVERELDRRHGAGAGREPGDAA